MRTLINILSWIYQHPVVIAVLVAVAAVIVIALMASARNAKKVDAVSAKPLSLSVEQAQKVSMIRRRNPARIIFRFPASFATDETIDTWAGEVAERLGDGFQPTEVRVISQKWWKPSMYEVTFARLESLR